MHFYYIILNVLESVHNLCLLHDCSFLFYICLQFWDASNFVTQSFSASQIIFCKKQKEPKLKKKMYSLCINKNYYMHIFSFYLTLGQNYIHISCFHYSHKPVYRRFSVNELLLHLIIEVVTH